jgi:hypothetical protein
MGIQGLRQNWEALFEINAWDVPGERRGEEGGVGAGTQSDAHGSTVEAVMKGDVE